MIILADRSIIDEDGLILEELFLVKLEAGRAGRTEPIE
jgi:hypothetical protein